METLKQSKMTGKILSCTSNPTRTACICCVETVSGKKAEQATYIIRMDKQGERYTAEKRSETALLESYNVDIWENTCECDGYNNGYECRHLRLVTALRNAGKVK